jgi:hypothetical protein
VTASIGQRLTIEMKFSGWHRGGALDDGLLLSVQRQEGPRSQKDRTGWDRINRLADRLSSPSCRRPRKMRSSRRVLDVNVTLVVDSQRARIRQSGGIDPELPVVFLPKVVGLQREERT